ncbi:MAG: hypothetical protein HDT20_02575 [Oscillibacter sp.]|nr:hypothetical protein [Oscillibacter sp.]
MNLKDAFRAQNKLQSLMDEASYILQDQDNTLKVTTTHLRSKVMPEAQDAVTEGAAHSEYAEHINQVAAFLMAMLSEREKLSAAICAAKAKLPLDMDSETGLNRARQSLADTFRRMAALRNSEVVIANGGSGYRFNGEGNQVSYRCDARRVTTINFDRNKIRGMATELGRKADEVSAKLDQCIVNTVVDYTLPFEMNDSFDVILSDFIQRQSE